MGKAFHGVMPACKLSYTISVHGHIKSHAYKYPYSCLFQWFIHNCIYTAYSISNILSYLCIVEFNCSEPTTNHNNTSFHKFMVPGYFYFYGTVISSRRRKQKTSAGTNVDLEISCNTVAVSQNWLMGIIYPTYLEWFVWEMHYDDVIMSAMASQITSLAFVYSAVYSGTDQRKHQSSASLAFVWGIHR